MDILKARSTADFLAMVPALAGIDVSQSIVFVPFRGNRTFPTVCRLDLPDRERRSDLRTLVHAALGVLSRVPGIDRVDVVVFSHLTYASERGIPHLELGRAAVDGLHRAGFHVGLAACVAGDGWGSYLDRTHHETGHPLDDIRSSSLGSELTGRADPGDAAGLRGRSVVDADADARDAVARILGYGDVEDDEELVAFERHLPLVDILDVFSAHDGQPAIIAMALVAFESPATRDIALLHYAFGREVGALAAHDAERWAGVVEESGRSMDEVVEADVTAGGSTELGDMLLGRTERIPDRERLVAAIQMLRILVAHAPDDLRPAPLTMLGWCLWALGAVSSAGAMLDRALLLDPAYRMAALLRTWIDAGSLPDWLFARLGSEH